MLKKRSIERNITFNISIDDIKIPEKCPVLNITLKRGRRKRGPDSASIDKIHNNLGYVKGNIEIISWKANSIKSNGTELEHRLIADYIRAHTVEDYMI